MESVKVPELGKAEEVTLTEWKVEAGSQVTAGTEVAEVETMKTAFSVEAPVSGVVKELIIGEGEKARMGGTIAHMASC